MSARVALNCLCNRPFTHQEVSQLTEANDYDALEAQILALFVTLSLPAQQRVMKDLQNLLTTHEQALAETNSN